MRPGGVPTTAIPWGTIVAVVLGSAVVAWWRPSSSALRASRMNAPAAIAHE